jgi:uncharacterized protein (TIGR02217 family)
MSIAVMRFPTDIAYQSVSGPEFSTDVVVTHGGHEQRNSNWQVARARYNVATGVRNQAQLDTLIAFFRICKGRAHAFRFKDWTDYTLVNETLGTGTGSATQFQLVKRYQQGTNVTIRTITRPVASSVKLYFNSTLQAPSTYTVNDTTGLITCNAAPANGVTVKADAEFDVWVRFDTDRLSAVLANYGAYSTQDIPLVEVRA